MYKRLFGERVRNLRLEKEMSPKQLAKMLGVSKTDIYYLENGYTEPGLKMIVQLIEIFNTTSGYLTGTEGELTERQKLIREFMNM
jgi:transcriptional regulator with XRE-family HTH domain